MMKTKLLLAGCLLLLNACVTAPEYRKANDMKGELKATDVNFQVLSGYYQDPPDCVVVMDANSHGHNETAKQVSVALARHLGEKIERIIFPRFRKEIEREQGFDLEDDMDRKRFSRKTRCRFYAVAELYDLGDDFVGVFAKKHVGVRVDIKRFSDNKSVWQAAHTVWRADGNVPFSPIGVLGGLASATMFKNDQEIIPSLIDDAMRRMVRTLPYGA